MRDRRRPDGRISHERWLVSYADFVTLLFAFFVVMYASAQMDQRKAGRLSVAIESAFQQLGIFQANGHKTGNVPHQIPLSGSRTRGDEDAQMAMARLAQSKLDQQKQAEFDAVRAELEKALASEIKRNEVAVRMDRDGLVVSLREVGFFDSGSATIRPGAEAALARVARILQEHAFAVRIEGHTDTVPIHTVQFASNWELSTARATELVKALIEKYGLPPDRLSAAGFAEFHPVAGNDTAKGRQMNRRVDVVILPIAKSSAAPDETRSSAMENPKSSHSPDNVHQPNFPPGA